MFLYSINEGDFTLTLYRADIDSELYIYSVRRCGNVIVLESAFFDTIEGACEWYANTSYRDITAIREGRM